MKIQLNGKRILEISGLPNAHQISMRALVSYDTVNRYLNAPEKVNEIDAGVLTRILLDGCGIAPERLMEMRIGDIFTLGEEGD